MSGLNLRLSGAVAVVLLLLSSCGSLQTDVETGTPDATIDAVTPDPLIKERANEHSPCPEGHWDFAPVDSFLTDGLLWMEFDKMTTAKYEDPNAVIASISPRVEGQAARPIDVTMHESYIEPLNWAVDKGIQTFLATVVIDGNPRPIVAAVIVKPDDSGPLFVGECAHQSLYEPLQAQFGEDEVGDIVARLPMMSRNDLQGLFATDEVPDSNVSDIVILNPEEVSEKVLSSLQFASVSLTLDPASVLGDAYTVCIKTTEGWNDCFVPDEATAREGTVVDAYVSPDGVFEIWLLDQDANLAEPISRIGVHTIDASLRSAEEIEVSITLAGDLRKADGAEVSVGAKDVADR